MTAVTAAGRAGGAQQPGSVENGSGQACDQETLRGRPFMGRQRKADRVPPGLVGAAPVATQHTLPHHSKAFESGSCMVFPGVSNWCRRSWRACVSTDFGLLKGPGSERRASRRMSPRVAGRVHALFWSTAAQRLSDDPHLWAPTQRLVVPATSPVREQTTAKAIRRPAACSVSLWILPRLKQLRHVLKGPRLKPHTVTLPERPGKGTQSLSVPSSHAPQPYSRGLPDATSRGATGFNQDRYACQLSARSLVRGHCG